MSDEGGRGPDSLTDDGADRLAGMLGADVQTFTAAQITKAAMVLAGHMARGGAVARDVAADMLAAVAPDIAAAARPPVCADGCQLAGWLAESPQQATEPSAPSRPGEEDRLRARRGGLLADMEERVRRECGDLLSRQTDEAVAEYQRGGDPFMLYRALAAEWIEAG